MSVVYIKDAVGSTAQVLMQCRTLPGTSLAIEPTDHAVMYEPVTTLTFTCRISPDMRPRLRWLLFGHKPPKLTYRTIRKHCAKRNRI